MKLQTKYSLSLNSSVVAEAKNSIHTSYFSNTPRNTYYVHLGAGVSELPFSALSLESYQLSAGSTSHNNMQKNVAQVGDTITYSFAATWSAISSTFVGTICEVGFGYSNSAAAFDMVSRARFLDNNDEPVLLSITEEDTLGIKAYMEVQKSINDTNVSFEATEDLTITGKLKEVNLDRWFDEYISQPLAANLNMSLFNSTNLDIVSNDFNRLSGSINIVKTDGLTRTQVNEETQRVDKYTGYFPPSNNYTFTHIGVHEGSGNVNDNYLVIIELDEPVTITEFEEFSLTLNVKLTEQEINA